MMGPRTPSIGRPWYPGGTQGRNPQLALSVQPRMTVPYKPTTPFALTHLRNSTMRVALPLQPQYGEDWDGRFSLASSLDRMPVRDGVRSPPPVRESVFRSSSFD